MHSILFSNSKLLIDKTIHTIIIYFYAYNKKTALIDEVITIIAKIRLIDELIARKKIGREYYYILLKCCTTKLLSTVPELLFNI